MALTMLLMEMENMSLLLKQVPATMLAVSSCPRTMGRHGAILKS